MILGVFNMQGVNCVHQFPVRILYIYLNICFDMQK